MLSWVCAGIGVVIALVIIIMMNLRAKLARINRKRYFGAREFFQRARDQSKR